jgi:hypothetical protein
MSEPQVLDWFAGTALGSFTREIPWAFPVFEILHFIGLCTMMGALLVVDLRVLGFGRNQVPIGAVLSFVPVAVVGFLVNLLTGAAFFCSDPGNYWFNPAFKWKMGLVVFGGLNALAFEFLERRRLAGLAADVDAGGVAKAIAALSIVTWLAVMVLGRILPYTGAGLG